MKCIPLKQQDKAEFEFVEVKEKLDLPGIEWNSKLSPTQVEKNFLRRIK